MTEELLEAVSATVHETWMATKRAQGTESRKSESGEELMVPYAELSEEAKNLDRNSVAATLAALWATGYRIVRIQPAPRSGT